MTFGNQSWILTFIKVRYFGPINKVLFYRNAGTKKVVLVMNLNTYRFILDVLMSLIQGLVLPKHHNSNQIIVVE